MRTLVVASPGLPQADPFFARLRVRSACEVIGDIELFARSGAGPVVGITGTNGKSTVTTLVARMAKRAAASRARVATSRRRRWICCRMAAPRLYVLELSSYQLETTHTLRARRRDGAECDRRITWTATRDLDSLRGSQGAHLRARGMAVLNLDDARRGRDGASGPRDAGRSRCDAASGADYVARQRRAGATGCAGAARAAADGRAAHRRQPQRRQCAGRAGAGRSARSGARRPCSRR